MEKFIAKAEINVYGITTIPKAKNGQVLTFYATFQEAYTAYKQKYGDNIPAPNQWPSYQYTDFIHRFVIEKGTAYSREGVIIMTDVYPQKVLFGETIFNIETYGKNNNQ